MSLRFTVLLAFTLAAFAFAPAADAQQMVLMDPGTWVTDITPDGEIVVGVAPGGGFRWAWRTEPAPTIFTGINDISGVSDDGSVLVGCIDDPGGLGEVAARWTETTGWQSLGWLPQAQSCPSRSNAYDVSGDGSTVIGLSWAGCSGRAFIWDEVNGMQELLNLANGHNRATVISTDGGTIAGFAQGSFSRTPAYWTPNLAGVTPDIDDVGEVYGLNDNGNWSVGSVGFGNNTRAFIRDEAGGTGYINLGSLYSDWAGHATDVSEDGSIICGFDSQLLARDAWVWTNEEGIVDMEDFVSDLGIAAAPVDGYIVASKMSNDGNVVVGAYDPEGIAFSGGFILEIQSDGAWTDLGGGTAGSNGTPSLSGTGSLQPNTVFSMDLVNAPPFAQMLVWISLTSTPVNAFGGTIHAFPPNTEFLFPANGAGEFSAASLWPTGIPSGTNLYFQFLIGDATALPWGISLSNGLQATTP